MHVCSSITWDQRAAKTKVLNQQRCLPVYEAMNRAAIVMLSKDPLIDFTRVYFYMLFIRLNDFEAGISESKSASQKGRHSSMSLTNHPIPKGEDPWKTVYQNTCIQTLSCNKKIESSLQGRKCVAQSSMGNSRALSQQRLDRAAKALRKSTSTSVLVREDHPAWPHLLGVSSNSSLVSSQPLSSTKSLDHQTKSSSALYWIKRTESSTTFDIEAPTKAFHRCQSKITKQLDNLPPTSCFMDE
eukprot:gene3835-6345_t